MPAPPPQKLSLEERIERARRLNGSIVACIGPSGCGKTETAVQLSLASAFLSNVKWWTYDSNGDVRVHFNGAMRMLQERMRNASDPAARNLYMRKLQFMGTCLADGYHSGPAKLPVLLRRIKALVAEGHKDAANNKNKRARVVVLIDEAGAVRDLDEHFWTDMRQARNAGATIVTTGHRVKDWHPAARANIRVAVVWKPRTDKFVEIGGLKIPRDQCTEPQSAALKFWVGDEPVPYVWDRARFPESYPPELIVPAQPTVARGIVF